MPAIFGGVSRSPPFYKRECTNVYTESRCCEAKSGLFAGKRCWLIKYIPKIFSYKYLVRSGHLLRNDTTLPFPAFPIMIHWKFEWFFRTLFFPEPCQAFESSLVFYSQSIMKSIFHIQRLHEKLRCSFRKKKFIASKHVTKFFGRSCEYRKYQYLPHFVCFNPENFRGV